MAVVAICLSIGIFVSCYFARSFREQLQTSAHALITDTLTDRVNRTCKSVLTQENDLLYEKKYSDAAIDLTVNAEETALLAQQVAIACAADLGGYETLVVSIPSGAFTNSAFLADKGRTTNYTLSAAYTVCGDYHVSYESVGINQVRYALYIQIVATAHVTIPRQIEDVRYSLAIPVCEKIYSGQVPNVFVNGEDATNYLDLLPD